MGRLGFKCCLNSRILGRLRPFFKVSADIPNSVSAIMNSVSAKIKNGSAKNEIRILTY